MKNIKIGDREFIITDEMETMGEKVQKILDETFPFGFSSARRGEINDATLRELGIWMYNHMHDFNRASTLIYMMLYSCFNERERMIVWNTFDENISVDFSEVMLYLLDILDKELAEYPATCQEIVGNFIKDESTSSDSLNFKYCVQSHLSSNTKWIAEDVVSGKRKAPKHIVRQCKKLLEYTDDYCIGDRYIGYLIGRSEVFLDILDTIYKNY